jgi:predicted methyltransferase
MFRFTPFILWLTVALSSVGCSGLSKVDVGKVLTSGRDGWQHPDQVVAALQISPGDRVAEIGAGTGYWLPRLSAAVGPDGRVYAVEVDAKLVAELEAFVEDEDLANVQVVFGAYEDPRLPDGEIDLAMTCLTYHHIGDRIEYFQALHSDLAPGGRIAHLDDRPGAPAPIAWFQADGHWTDPELILSEMDAAGYDAVSDFDFLPAQSFQIFVTRRDPSGSASDDPAGPLAGQSVGQDAAGVR